MVSGAGLNTIPPALVAECCIPPDAALEESPFVVTVPGKLCRPQLLTVLVTNAGVQGGAKVMASVVAHWLDLFLQISQRVGEIITENTHLIEFSVCRLDLLCSCKQPCLHCLPVLYTAVIAKTGLDHPYKVIKVSPSFCLPFQ